MKRILLYIIAVLCITVQSASAQYHWVSLDGPYEGPGGLIARDGQGTLLSVLPNAFAVTSDNGTTWEKMELNHGGAHRLHVFGDNVLLAAAGGLFRAESPQYEFTKIADFTCYDAYMYPNGDLLACSPLALLRSTDMGQTWDTLHPYTSSSHGYFAFTATDDGFILVPSLGEGILRSTDYGNTWGIVFEANRIGSVYHDIYSGAFYAVESDSGLYKSTDRGSSWSLLPNTSFSDGRMWFPEVGKHFAGQNSKLRYSEDNDKTWGEIDFEAQYPYGVFVVGDEIWVSHSNGIGYSIDGGGTWTNIAAHLQLHAPDVLHVMDNGYIFAGGTALFRSTDYGNSWSKVLDSWQHTDIEVDADKRIYIAANKLYRSTDLGTSWEAIGNTWPFTWIWDMALRNETIVCRLNEYIVASRNDFVDWEVFYIMLGSVSSGYPSAVGITGNGDILATSSYRRMLHKTTDYGTTWSEDGSIEHHARRMRFNSNDDMYISTYEHTIDKSTDGGDTWTALVENIGYPIEFHVLPNDRLLVCTLDSVILSSDDGATWTNITGDLPDGRYWSLSFDPWGYIYVGVGARGVYKTAEPVAVGVTELPAASETDILHMYPNPVSLGQGSVTLAASQQLREPVNIAVYDALGRKVHEQTSTAQAFVEIPLSGMRQGVYYVAVRGTTVHESHKLIVTQ